MSRVIQAFAQFFDGAGDPLSNGWISFLESGTNNTLKETYVDSKESFANTNPLQLDAEGRCPNVFGSGSYRAILYTNDPLLNTPLEQIQVFDPVGGVSGTADFTEWNALATYNIGDVVKGSDNKFYESLANDNSNQDPTTATNYWEQLDFIYVWNEYRTYDAGDRVTDPVDGFDYISIAGINLNNIPSATPLKWDNFAIKASAAPVAAEGDIQVARVIAEGDTQEARVISEGDTQDARVIAEGDTQDARVIAEGDTQVARVLSEGDTQDARVETEGDTQYTRLINVGAAVNKSVRQTVLTGPDLEGTPSTIETAATKTGDLRSAYHDLGMDMLTGSRGGMVIAKGTAAGGNQVVQASILTNARSRLRTNTTDVMADDADWLQQFTASGIQYGADTVLTDANLAAFQTTHKTVLDGNEWHYNPSSGFAMCKYIGTGAAFNLQHPMGKEPLWFAIKRLPGTLDWYTSNIFEPTRMMNLNLTSSSISATSVWPAAHTNTYITLGTSTGVNTTNEHFLFGWFGDPLDDLEVGMSGERGVTASWISTGGQTVDTGITDIQTIIFKDTTSVGDWAILNKASGFGNFTILNDTDAETTQSIVTVSGSEVTFASHSLDYLVIVVGGTADAPDNKLKAGTKVLRKIGTETTGHRVDLGAAFSGGDNGGMVFGRAVESAKNTRVTDTIRGATNTILTGTDAIEFVDADAIEGFTTTGVTLGGSTGMNSLTYMNQYTAFNTTHKTTTGDGLAWSYNPLTGFAMCKYIGDGVAGRTLTHPMGKKLRMGWFKNLDTVISWRVYLASLGYTKRMYLDLTNTALTDSTSWNDTETTDTLIILGTDTGVNENTKEHIFYGWFGDDLTVDPDVTVSGELGVSAFFQYAGGSGAMSVDTGIGNITAIISKQSSAVGGWSFINLSSGTYYVLNDTTVEVVGTYTVEGSVVSFAGQTNTLEFMVFGSKADSGVDNDVILPSSVSEPTIATMANGFNEYGNIDIIEKVAASQTLNVTGDEGKKLIYMKSDGLLYFSGERPEYIRGYTPYVKDNFVYDIDKALMYNASGYSSSILGAWTDLTGYEGAVIEGQIITFDGSSSQRVININEWDITKSYRVRGNVMAVSGGSVYLPYRTALHLQNSPGEFDYIDSDHLYPDIRMRCEPGVTAVVQVYDIQEVTTDAVTPAVFIGECMLDNLGNVYDIKTYAKGELYEIPWFAALTNSVFTFDNPFGINNVTIETFHKRAIDSDIIQPIVWFASYTSIWDEVGALLKIEPNKITVQVGTRTYGFFTDTGDFNWGNDGFYKLKLRRTF